MPLLRRVWGGSPARLALRVPDPVGRGFMGPASPSARAGDPRELVVRPALGRDHLRIDAVRRGDREWLAPWEATMPPEADEPVPAIAEYCNRIDREQREGRTLMLVVEADGKVAGQYSLSNVQRGAMSQGMLGYWLASSWSGRGLGALVAAMVIDLAIGELGLHRVEVCVRPENERSLALCRRLGLHEEGLRRRFMHIAGKWADHVAFSIDRESLPEGGLVVAKWGKGIDE